MVLLCRNNATINAHAKTHTGSNTGSDRLTQWPGEPWPRHKPNVTLRRCKLTCKRNH